MSNTMKIAVALTLLILGCNHLLGYSSYCLADIYTYTDEDGTIHFVEKPNQVPTKSKIESIYENDRDLNIEFEENYSADDKIEAARNATVRIETSDGHGSGFFITPTGYLLTNKHVLKGSKDRLKAKQREYDIREKELKKYGFKLRKANEFYKKEAQWLAERLELIRKLALEPNNQKLYSTRVAEYTIRKNQYDNEIREFQRHNRIYEEEMDKLRALEKEIGRMRSKAFSGGGVDVVLINGRELYAYVKAVSDRYDLILLKLSKSLKTPYLRQGDVYQMSDGSGVYSIGNPLHVGHSVSFGVISGIKRMRSANYKGEKEYIQTTADMSPGVSGGPLIDEYGRVIGINTWGIKGIMSEGLNFAIPIDIAIKEFSRYLQ